MNAIAHALAHGQASAMSQKSVHAKISEVKSPDLTSPDLPDLTNPVVSPWSVGDGDQASNVTYVEGRAARRLTIGSDLNA